MFHIAVQSKKNEFAKNAQIKLNLICKFLQNLLENRK